MGGRVLAIECATEACSVALFEDSQVIDRRYAILGRGHAERLVPMIAELEGRGRADRILVSLGPGSFTGVRIGLAAARALGLAWNAEVRGYPTLALVARVARGQVGDEPVSVCMIGGHGEWFVQNFSVDFQPEDEPASLPPRLAAEACRHAVIAGSQATSAADMLADARNAMKVLPDAAGAFALPEAMLRTDLAPIYGRPPDAKVKAAS